MTSQVKTAWVIYWESMGSNPEIPVVDNQVAAILSSRVGIEKAAAALETLYKQAAYNVEEQIRWRQPGAGPYKVTNNLRLHGVPAIGLSYSIGHNPILTLRKVERLKHTETEVSWIEKSVAHPEWLCKEIGHPDCKLVGLPAEERIVRFKL